MLKKNREIKIIFFLIMVLFTIFLLLPMVRLLGKAVIGTEGFSLNYFTEVFLERNFGKAVLNSFAISGTSAVLTTVLAFFLAYTVNYTNINTGLKKLIRSAALLPMLLPTITYGFAIIYSFGKQGLLTKLFGSQIFQIYGFAGLLYGYVIYTLPVCFMLIDNSMHYIDRKYIVVSRVMGDNSASSFWMTVAAPLLPALGASFIQSFFLCFTDFGIPASVGGKVEVLAGVLYSQMLGSVPDFNKGAVIALVMLIPSILSIALLNFLERFQIRYHKQSEIELKKNRVRDFSFGFLSFLILVCILSVFLVIFIVPFVEEWPYNIKLTLTNIKNVFNGPELTRVYLNSLWVAFLSAAFGTLTAYGAALATARSELNEKLKSIIESIAMITNTIPGMVLGLSFLFAFSGSSLQNTFLIIVLCNIVHFFSAPYLMMKGALDKMNASFETTARLMGDTWLKTILRVVTPNAVSTILGVFSYYFMNALVTVSAVIFLSGARTMVITAKIKELQHYAKFNEIFVLSLLILFTNILGKVILQYLAEGNKKGDKSK